MNSVKNFKSASQNWKVVKSENFEEKMIQEITSKINVENKICADLSCGTGFISFAMAQEADIVYSMDNNQNVLRGINNGLQNKRLKNIYPVKGYMENLPFFEGSLDVVCTNMALHHLKYPDKAIHEMYRILKTDGKAVIADIVKHNGEWAKEEMNDFWLGFSYKQIKDWLKDAGFTGISILHTNLSCAGYSSKGECTETGIFIATGVKRRNLI